MCVAVEGAMMCVCAAFRGGYDVCVWLLGGGGGNDVCVCGCSGGHDVCVAVETAMMYVWLCRAMCVCVCVCVCVCGC